MLNACNQCDGHRGVEQSRPPAHGIARGSLPLVARRVRAAGAAEAIQSRGTGTVDALNG
jgi:hypothetical protein